MPTPLPWRLKAWDGGAFVNCELRRWNGSDWVTADMYFWDGGAWVLCTDRTPPTSTQTIDYGSIWHMSYYSNGNLQRNDGQQNTKNFQGDSNADGWDIQSSSWGFASTIHTDIDGAVAYYYAQAFLDNDHTWFGSGMTAVIGTHAVNSGSPPSTLSANRIDWLQVHFGSNEAKWVNLGTQFDAYADDGSFYGLVLAINSSNQTYYGYFNVSATVELSFEK